MSLFKKYVRGNTIIEVLIAMVIISVCISLAMVMFLNVQRGNLTFFKVKAVEAMEHYMKETLNKKTFFEESYKMEEFTIRKSIIDCEAYPDCKVIRLIVFDGDKNKLGELESIVHEAQ
jgi:prepilin-type N-terminal cleavage/methylation domain-containing protein